METRSPCVTARTARVNSRALALGAALTLAVTLAPAPTTAQLRPLRPLEWEVFEPATRATLRLGVGSLQHQRASLAGTEGRLLEIGDFSATLRSGRVAFEVGGTAARLFDDRSRWADTSGGARLSFGRRNDAGDLTVATALRLSPMAWPALLVLRFGARLPTTDHLAGLDREETDFLGTLGIAVRKHGFLAAGEAGLGILGTRIPEFEQQDDLIYAARLAYRLGPLQPEAAFLGQSSPLRYRRPRGNEDLRELRLGLRLGSRRWLQAQWVHGFVPFSPSSGLLVTAGTLLRTNSPN